jgi:hypothetical protein
MNNTRSTRNCGPLRVDFAEGRRDHRVPTSHILQKPLSGGPEHRPSPASPDAQAGSYRCGVRGCV